MTVSRRSFLTGAASCATLAATGGIGAVGGGVPVTAITAEDVAIARTYKSIFDDGMFTYRPLSSVTCEEMFSYLTRPITELPLSLDRVSPLVAFDDKDMLPVEIQGTIERTGT